MAVQIGSRIGPYEIESALGAGGMGEVYRARDTRLNRRVAIKSLPTAFAQDPERVARFKREAQLLAALNHPHIAGIHGLEESTVHNFSFSSSSMARRSRIAWPGDRFRSMRRSELRAKSLMRWRPRTRRASSIAISSLRMSR